LQLLPTRYLKELRLSERVTVTGVEPKRDSPRYAVELTEQTAPEKPAFHHFYVARAEVMSDTRNLGWTVEGLKRYVHREVERLFPDSATQE
jgi:hypothetical protein